MRHYQAILFTCCIFFGNKSFCQDTLRSSYTDNILITAGNYSLDEIVNLGPTNSNRIINKSSLTGKISWVAGPVLYEHQETEGLYQSVHNDSIYAIATGGFHDGKIKIFGLWQGGLQKEIKNKNNIAYKGISISQDGKYIFAVDDKGYLQKINLSTGVTSINKQILKGKYPDEINSWSLYSLRNDSVLVIGMKGAILVYDMARGKPINEIRNLNKEIDQIAISNDYNFFAIANNRRINIYSSNGQLFKEIKTPYEIHTVTFTPDGQNICISKNGLNVQYCSFKENSLVQDYPTCPIRGLFDKYRSTGTVEGIGYEDDTVLFMKFLAKSIVLSTVKGIYFRYYTTDANHP